MLYRWKNLYYIVIVLQGLLHPLVLLLAGLIAVTNFAKYGK